MPVTYRFAICNELFQTTPLDRVCQTVSQLGYQGLEIAPFTLDADPASLTPAKRAEIRQTIAGAGLEFAGLHWLLAAPPWIHITTNDESIRQRSWTYVKSLIDLCADLVTPSAPQRPVIVFGSPKQRTSVTGSSTKEANKFFAEGMASVAAHAASANTTLLVEALSPSQTDVCTSLAAAVSIVRQIASPAVQTMFDVHNAIDEDEAHTALVEKYFSYIRHVHVNELDGREPGMGDYDFAQLLHKLTDLNYSGWVSLEAFDFSRDPRDVAARAITTLKAAQSVKIPLTSL